MRKMSLTCIIPQRGHFNSMDEIKINKYMRPGKVCLCKDVTREDIKELIRGGERKLSKIIQLTRASTGCGTCFRELVSLVRLFTKEVEKAECIQKELPLY